MKMKHILLFYISMFIVPFSAMAQEETSSTNDTLTQPERYGIRVGADLSKPLRTLLEEGYSGFEVMGDFRFNKKFYFAAEIGNEKRDFNEPNLNSTTSGSYAKIGFDYNAYENWLGMENMIYGGLRYGFSTFKQELISYSVYTDDQTFPTVINSQAQEFEGLTAHWAELIVGVKAEIFNNLYFSINLQLKRKISDDKPENFDNLFIPGYNRTYDFSKFGAGYGYSISYLIPIYKK